MFDRVGADVIEQTVRVWFPFPLLTPATQDIVIQAVRPAGAFRVVNGPIFPPGLNNNHVWAEIYFPTLGWMPVDVTYSEVACLAPGLTDAQKHQVRDYFFGRMDRWRLCTQRSQLAQRLTPVKRSPRRRLTMFVTLELECGGQQIATKAKITWDCRPVAVGEEGSKKE